MINISYISPSKCPYDDTLVDVTEWTFRTAEHRHTQAHILWSNTSTINSIICEHADERHELCDIYFFYPKIVTCKSNLDEDDDIDEMRDWLVTDLLELWTCKSEDNGAFQFVSLKCHEEGYKRKNDNNDNAQVNHHHANIRNRAMNATTGCHISMSRHCYASYDPTITITRFMTIMVIPIVILICVTSCLVCGWVNQCGFFRKKSLKQVRYKT